MVRTLMGKKIRQKRESLAKGKEWVNSASNKEVTETITEKTIFEQDLKGVRGQPCR